MVSREAPIVRQIQLAASALSSRLWRNTVGSCVLGKAERVQRDGAVFLQTGDIVVRKGRISVVGLPTGSGDLIGLRQIEITADMVGKTVAQFCSVECKEPGGGRVSQEQRHWHESMLGFGACSGIVKSIVEAEELLRSKP